MTSDEKPSYTLDEMLVECDPDAPMPDDLEEWLEAPPVGEESL